jgi:uncharacterized protein with PIN domain
MKFIADAMLGKLARWLRLMGYDVLYGVELEDAEIIENAKDRVVLTRDRALYEKVKKVGLEAILIRDMDIKDQLLQMKEVGIELRDTPFWARCPLCNGKIKTIEREKIKVDVPRDATGFFVCVDCQNIYWEGSHWKNIKDTIKDVESRGKDVQNPK